MISIPVNLQLGIIQLKDKPTATLHYNFFRSDSYSDTLLVFLNGLVLPQSSWLDTITQIAIKTEDLKISRPHLLSYDRYGQGLSDRDTSDKHDINDVVKDLHAFLQEFTEKELSPDGPPRRLIFVANSIGCAIARVFAASYPGKISGLIFLDSMMAHIDLVSLWPDPDDPSFDERTLPGGTTADQLRQVREKYRRIFDIRAPNPEGLDRSGLAKLLPLSDSPNLKGVDGTPWVTVVGHDPDTFAEENEKSFGVPQVLVNKYINPVWHDYNQGLTKLTDENRTRGPIIAKTCGHFIQRDDPAFVAAEVCDLLQKLNAQRRRCAE